MCCKKIVQRACSWFVGYLRLCAQIIRGAHIAHSSSAKVLNELRASCWRLSIPSNFLTTWYSKRQVLSKDFLLFCVFNEATLVVYLPFFISSVLFSPAFKVQWLLGGIFFLPQFSCHINCNLPSILNTRNKKHAEVRYDSFYV